MREKLPVLGVAVAAWRDVLGNLPGLARIAWPYYALAAALIVLGSVAGQGDRPAGFLAPLLGEGVAGIVLALCTLACAVRWQRHVVLAEPLRGIAPLDGRALRYAFWNVAVGLIAALPMAASALAGYAAGAVVVGAEGETPFMVGPAGLALLAAGALAALTLLMRLGLVPVGVSVGDPGMGFRRSWGATRGNGLRLLGVMLLLIPTFGAFAWVGALPSLWLDAAAASVIQALVDLVTGMVAASALAGIYRRLTPAGA